MSQRVEKCFFYSFLIVLSIIALLVVMMNTQTVIGPYLMTEKDMTLSATEEESEKEEEVIPKEPEYVVYTSQLSAYCACAICTGKDPSHAAYGKTKSGTQAVEGRTVAVDPDVIPLGSTVEIYGHKYIAEDTGGSVKGTDVDIYFNAHDAANRFGIPIAEIKVYKKEENK